MARPTWRATLLGTLACLSVSAGCAGPTDTGDAGPMPDAGPGPQPDAGPDLDAGPEDPGAPWYELAGTDADLPEDDLAPLASLVEGTAVVGIGESVHTTGGELRMRARLIRHLVATLGYRVVVLENEWEQTERVIAPYIDDGVGTAEEAALGINPIWWDRSTPELFAWLRAFNVEHPDDPVHVVGCDIRQAWWDHPAVTAFLQAWAPDDATTLSGGMTTCLGVGYEGMEEFFGDPVVQGYFAGSPMPTDAHTACQEGTEAALAFLEEHRADLVAAAGERDFEWARLRVVGMRAFDLSIYHLSRGQLEEANGPRDEAMADVFLTQRRIDRPDDKAILFAHNGHVMTHSDEVVLGQWVGVKNLGTRLSEALGDEYAAIGQLSRTTHIDWFNGPETLAHNQLSTLERVLDAIGPEFLLVDTAQATAGEAPLWIPDRAYAMGFDTLLPAHHYRALVFHRESPANDWFTPPPFAGP